jgi:ABC-2 type transport system ATP-binding protein
MIHTEKLNRHFRHVEAVHGLNLDVPEGAIFALVGPNGAGKSTTIRTLVNLLQPTSGRAEVLGTDSRRLGPGQFRQIGYFSEDQLPPGWMRTGEFLEYCSQFYPTWDRELAKGLVSLFQLPLDRKLGSLSRGMRVKAMLASSLAYRPRLIILDEPFSGEDALVRDQLIEAILDRTPESTVLLSSHDLAEIESFASHIAFLEAGRLQFVQETAQLLHRFREVEVTLADPAPPSAALPAEWLNPESISVVVRFTDSRFDEVLTEATARRIWPGVRQVTARPLPLRSIFVALAKTGRMEE